MPYLLSAFRRYAADGTPPFRALALDYDDEALSRRHLLVQVYGDGDLAWQDGSGSDQGTELRWNKESQGGEVISNEGYIVKGWKHMS